VHLFKSTDVLPVFSINDLQVGCFMSSAVNNLLPKSFRNMFMFNSNVHSHNTRKSNALHQTQYRLNMSKFSIIASLGVPIQFTCIILYEMFMFTASDLNKVELID